MAGPLTGVDDRRLAVGGFVALGLGNLALAASNALAGDYLLAGAEAVVVLGIAAILLGVRSDESALTFDADEHPLMARYAPLGIALMGIVILVAGLLALGSRFA